MSSKGSRASLLMAEIGEIDEQFSNQVPIGLGCALDSFREVTEMKEILDSLSEIHNNPLKVEKTYENYSIILNRYQEQPHLIDKHLEEWLSLLLLHARNRKENPALSRLALKFMRMIFKVRGPKEVVKRMPHEISDLVPVLEYLESENLDDPGSWESGFVLVHWLSILVMNPFSLKLLDNQTCDTSKIVSQRIMDLCYKTVILNNAIGLASPTLVYRFLSRPDMIVVYMKPFIDWTCNIVEGKGHGKLQHRVAARLGAFSALAALFKHSKRQEILPYGEQVLKAVLASKYENGDSLIKKLAMKLIQRIGMMFLKTNVAPWRYQRGSRSLLMNMKKEPVASKELKLNDENENLSSSNNDDDEYGSYEELNTYGESVETVLDKLLSGLREKDTIVRWSAAKGIGRVTNRLPKEYADEVVENILGNFLPRENNQVWHGSCLAIAELGRRGLLLPSRLKDVIPLIKKAMVFDEVRGHFSVGAHVRDAACYVLWAFARAFDPLVMKEFMNDISCSLIVTMLFDREINCRRAASAAFQENVGRQGNMPHGIDIVSTADYFAVGSRTNAFTVLSVEIAKYRQYLTPMVENLLEYKFNHIDVGIRELTGTALRKLTPLDPEYFIDTVLPRLIPMCLNPDITNCHGALCSLGSILVALRECNHFKLEPELIQKIREIVPELIRKNIANARMQGKTLIRMGLIYFIQCASLAKLPYHADTEWVSMCHKVLEDAITSEETKLRQLASESLRDFLIIYYYNNPLHHFKLSKLLDLYCANVKSGVLNLKHGYSCALGKFPIPIVRADFTATFLALIECAIPRPETAQWAECRRDAVESITNIFSRLQVTPTGKNLDELASDEVPIHLIPVERLLKFLVTGMEDYTNDAKKGDIGSLVRIATVQCARVVIPHLHDFSIKQQMKILDDEIIEKIFCRICKQCVETIDNVRVQAGKAFNTLLHHNPPIESVPERDEIIKIFPQDFCTSVNWRSSSQTFPRFVQLLRFQELCLDILCGFCTSGGSMSEGIMRDANGAVANYLLAIGALGPAETEKIVVALITILKENPKVDRITIPLMKFVTKQLQRSLFSDVNEEILLDFIAVVKKESLRCGRIDKVITIVELLCELMQTTANVAKTCMRRLVVFLCAQFPRVRTVTAAKVYEAMMSYGNVFLSPEQIEMGMTLLADHSWSEDLDKCRPVREKFCVCLDIPVPVIKQSEPVSTTISPIDMGHSRAMEDYCVPHLSIPKPKPYGRRK